jgi:beta-galactosidase
MRDSPRPAHALRITHRGGAVLLALLIALAAPVEAQRQRVTVNDGWRFWNDDAPGAEAAAYDDGAWETVDLPHTWNAEDAFDETPGYRRGVGWYRRALEVPASLKGKRLFLYFEGANQTADVWVNGRAVGGHVGGYTAFAVEITDAVQPGADDALAVRVDNRHDPDIAPLDADFTFYGGIYRDVWLVAVDPVHFSLEDAGPGVWLDTPGLAEGDTRVRARALVENAGAAPVEVETIHTLRAPDGEVVTQWRQSGTLAAGASERMEAWSGPIPDPQLYTPEAPAVYTVHSQVLIDGEARDAVAEPLGFRWVRADGDGFWLNGERRQLIGTNRHQDRAGWGNALPDALHREDVRLVKENGFDFLRLAHYPQDEAVLNEADRLGLLVWEEIPVVNQITQSEAFAENAERRLVEMIRQHYNHPSVVMWGTMNEIFLRRPDPLPEGYDADVGALAERLEAVAQAEDQARLTAMAVSFHEVPDRLADLSDVFGMNLYFGWYYETFEDLGVFLDSLHAAHPDVPLMLSEYGAGSDERVHAADPVRFDFSTEHAEAFHRATLQTVRERPWMVGSAVWNQFDFGSAFRQDTKDGINQKGLFYFDRTPKDVAFYYRAALKEEPVFRVERDHLHRAGPRRQRVQVFTNALQVALAVNGEPAGEAAPENGLAVFTVALAPGENRVEATGLWPTHGARADAATLHYSDPAAFFAGAPDAPPAVALNVGGAYSFTGAGGLVYLAEGDWPGAVPDTRARRTHHRIAGTAEDARFQSWREMPTSWALPTLPPGTYDLTLGLVENEHDRPGARVFSVSASGAPVARDLDLAAEAGRWRAVERTVRLTLDEAAAPVLRFAASAGAPVLSTLVLRRL